jgi:hypothetical protein
MREHQAKQAGDITKNTFGTPLEYNFFTPVISSSDVSLIILIEGLIIRFCNDNTSTAKVIQHRMRWQDDHVGE